MTVEERGQRKSRILAKSVKGTGHSAGIGCVRGGASTYLAALAGKGAKMKARRGLTAHFARLIHL